VPPCAGPLPVPTFLSWALTSGGATR
jgi:hypothetical protein